MKPTIIIGGGIVGLFTAYYLYQQGVEVVVVDKGDLKTNCSTGNAGMIVPSHIVPLASPGMIQKGLTWMLSSKSPFYIHPRLDKRLYEWCLLFYRSANKSHVQKSIPYLKNLSIWSKRLYLDFVEQNDIGKPGLEQKGVMMLYQTPAVEKEETELAELANKHGLETKVLNQMDIQQLEPHQKVNALGAVLYPGDAHLFPGSLHTYLMDYLQDHGVKILANTYVESFETNSQEVTAIITSQGRLACGKLVLTAGSWSGILAGKLGFKLPMMGGKGYSFMQRNEVPILQATLLADAKVSVSPYGQKVRFGGTMEITGLDETINMQRVKGIYESVQRYYPDFPLTFPDQSEVWTGLRPCSPDGLPYIGKAPKWKNVLVGTGHSMMGISLAPATGKILAELHAENHPKIELEGFKVDRFR